MAMTIKKVVALISLIALSALAQAPASQITVAAAANLTEVAHELGARFESETGIHAVFSFGSTAQLMQQIENGAPFDVFLAADAEHVRELDQKRLLVPSSRAPYADGILALWIPSPESGIDSLQDLASPRVHVIAVAKPELAPYGAATMESLRSAGILEKVKAKIVYADNINMAKQYGTSGNADAVFTAYSLVLKERGKVIRVDKTLHRPIVQELGIASASAHKQEAARFTDFVLHGAGQTILKDYGYKPPEKEHS